LRHHAAAERTRVFRRSRCFCERIGRDEGGQQRQGIRRDPALDQCRDGGMDLITPASAFAPGRWWTDDDYLRFDIERGLAAVTIRGFKRALLLDQAGDYAAFIFQPLPLRHPRSHRRHRYPKDGRRDTSDTSDTHLFNLRRNSEHEHHGWHDVCFSLILTVYYVVSQPAAQQLTLV
jgi:hypothetical protein